ncbi:MAG TPA: hypothetical protein VH092_30355, partial [Urbifossiella sp.]|nr:hypothetical protein [Urbifossiella sp.]
MRRFTFAAAALAALGMSGCVEGEQTFTLNPDGSGKVRIDVVMAPPGFLEFGGGGGPEPETADGFRQKALRVLLQSKGVGAWKDVAAGFNPDGRFKFAGTAYFDKIGELDIKELAMGGKGFSLTPAPGGGLVLGPSGPGPGGPPIPEPSGPFSGPGRKTPAEFAKMTDAELDGYILTDRIKFQATRPLMRAVMSGVKMKVTYQLPGKVKD